MPFGRLYRITYGESAIFGISHAKRATNMAARWENM